MDNLKKIGDTEDAAHVVSRPGVAGDEISLIDPRLILVRRKQSGNLAATVTLLMLGNEIQHYQDRIAALDQRLNISLPEKREKRENLEKQLEDNTCAQQQQTDLVSSCEAELEKLHIDRAKQESMQMLTIKQLESRIVEIRPTRILRQAGRSARPVGSSAFGKVTLGLLLGLMLGVLGALVVEFLRRSKVT